MSHVSDLTVCSLLYLVIRPVPDASPFREHLRGRPLAADPIEVPQTHRDTPSVEEQETREVLFSLFAGTYALLNRARRQTHLCLALNTKSSFPQTPRLQKIPPPKMKFQSTILALVLASTAWCSPFDKRQNDVPACNDGIDGPSGGPYQSKSTACNANPPV